MIDPHAWRDLLEHQCGVVSALQAVHHGMTSHALRAQVAAGRWRRVHRGVYLTCPGAMSYEQQVWAAVLYAGPGALAARETAMWLHDRGQREPELVHVIVPRSRDARSAPGLRVHRSALDARDVQPDAAPPRARVEHAVLHVAGAAGNDEAAIARVSESVQARLTTPARLRSALARQPRLRRRALIAEVLQMCDDGAHTLLEQAHERVRLAHGLPRPVRQMRHGTAVVDVDYDGLIVELDGRSGHFTVSGWWKDMLRDDLHTVAGRATLRFPGFLLLTRPWVVAHVEAAALRRRGWTGTLRCPRGCPGFPIADAA